MQKQSKPYLEKITPEFGSSIYYERFTQKKPNSPPIWHYHPEIEIVYINKGRGKRQIGSHLSYYTKGTLLLIGENLPHSGFSEDFSDGRNETIIQLLPENFGDSFFETPEMNGIHTLLQQAKKGIIFKGKTKERIGKHIEKLINLNPFDKFLGVLKVLKLMQESKELTLLNAKGFLIDKRINLIFNFVQQEFTRSITLDEISQLVHMTVPSFCRYFKKITGKTFIEFLNEYRIVHATKLLHEKQMSITDICYQSGFTNFSIDIH